MTRVRQPEVRLGSVPDWFEPFATYCAARRAEDRHVWASTLYDELLELGAMADVCAVVCRPERKLSRSSAS